ncbi:Uncharacterised protein [Nocardia otitidiscaviarum]|uniref:Secreted protein n=1 Tax=Nocardia otitidiscaviarum TaxID=1823 RepID=A0A378YWT8_9NOCA|nr:MULTISPECIES: hypothetical protein [Nocardia]MBF6180962.1 hypothetical protein [Nocardia otitidiscaviarum]MBF6237378.1 hypothetical protein [Nocardia otitidiscaviarum]MCP9624595.1 hypothetical protein [Nocardia otitidiscaviarum]QDP80170.1 hypothetical protein FOH10_17065 [Nocardia otitidiscaviarum]SUA80970.1 Uncharacterised protein [Nocardia otitidiscaviarum]
MMNRLRPHRRTLSIGSAVLLTAAGLAAMAAPASAAGVGCRIDRPSIDSVTFTCPDDVWYVGIVRCLGSRAVGHGQQAPTFIVSDSARPFAPMTLTCNGESKRGIALDAWTDGV